MMVQKYISGFFGKSVGEKSELHVEESLELLKKDLRVVYVTLESFMNVFLLKLC